MTGTNKKLTKDEVSEKIQSNMSYNEDLDDSHTPRYLQIIQENDDSYVVKERKIGGSRKFFKDNSDNIYYPPSFICGLPRTLEEFVDIDDSEVLTSTSDFSSYSKPKTQSQKRSLEDLITESENLKNNILERCGVFNSKDCKEVVVTEKSKKVDNSLESFVERCSKLADGEYFNITKSGHDFPKGVSKVKKLTGNHIILSLFNIPHSDRVVIDRKGDKRSIKKALRAFTKLVNDETPFEELYTKVVTKIEEESAPTKKLQKKKKVEKKEVEVEEKIVKDKETNGKVSPHKKEEPKPRSPSPPPQPSPPPKKEEKTSKSPPKARASSPKGNNILKRFQKK